MVGGEQRGIVEVLAVAHVARDEKAGERVGLMATDAVLGSDIDRNPATLRHALLIAAAYFHVYALLTVLRRDHASEVEDCEVESARRGTIDETLGQRL